MSNKIKNFRILVSGGDGQLAKSFSEIYPKQSLFLLGKRDFDVTDRKNALKKISKFNPDIIFHLASMTRGEESAKSPELSYKINVIGTRNIVEVCKKLDIALLFISTNEVFDGKNQFPYKETDKPNPITVIGKNKYEAETIIRENLKKYFIVRSSWLYSKWSLNFLHAVFNKARKDKRLELVIDEVSSPTYSLDLAKAIKKLIKTKKYGTYNLNNTGVVSRLEFAKKAFEIAEIKNIKIIPVKLESYKRLSKPPLYSALDNSKAKNIGINFPRWNVALKNFLKSNNI
ncbi:MAG TPA: dTDP-4-dehydrorhamnose reductase [Candidatus Sulfotelmatobacter sp.]|nr:dTDP-4-dehydrorhamnose reductase [Candidatus Sulfotelmatobacter sp.]